MIPDKDKLLGKEEGGELQCLASLVTHHPVKLAADGGGVIQVEGTTEGVQPPEARDRGHVLGEDLRTAGPQLWLDSLPLAKPGEELLAACLRLGQDGVGVGHQEDKLAHPGQQPHDGCVSLYRAFPGSG